MKRIIILILSNFICFLAANPQTYIKSGEVSGNWYKGHSPYVITGDINVPQGKSLNIEPGVKVVFDGPYILNVQGNLFAEGTKSDSILFTVTDTIGFSKFEAGWNGIHFDPRPVIWENIAVIDYAGTSSKSDRKQNSIKLKPEDLISDSIIYTSGIKTKSRISFCRFEYGSSCKRYRPYIFGGAIYIYQYTDLIVKNSLFYKCNSYSGGAIYCKEAAPVISNNLIRSCNSLSSGGGMVFIYSGPIISNNTIINNRSGYNAGGILFFECCPYVINNRILQNTAYYAGGGIHIEKLSTPVILYNNYEINGNTRKSSDMITAQNLIEILSKRIWENSNGKFYNNIICKNSSVYGGGMSMYSSAPEFNNTTLCDNYGISGGGLYLFYSSPLIINSIIFNNTSDNNTDHQIFVSGKNRLEIRNSDLQSDINCIQRDSVCNLELIFSDLVNDPPLFVDPEKLIYSLKAGSPCIDAGTIDTSAYLLSKTDIDGNQRVINSIVDLGAIEFQSDANGFSQKSTRERISASSKEVLFNLYPNPTQGEITLVIYNNPYDKILVQLYSSNGTIIYDNQFSTQENSELLINLNDVQSGVYIFKVITNDKVIYSNTIRIK